MSTKNPHILIVDDEPEFHQQVRYAFRRNYTFEGAASADHLRKKLDSPDEFDLILLDLVINKAEGLNSGLALIDQIKEWRPEVPIIVVTNDRQTGTIVEAMKRGARDFLHKGEYDYDFWNERFRAALEPKGLKQENQTLLKEIQRVREQHEYANPPDYPLIGSSPQMEHIRRTLKIVADEPDLTVLITGETGVGKSLAARFLHYNSLERRNKPFEEILISNIPKSLMESTLFGAVKGSFTDSKADIVGRLHLADKGIVFLDEIGDLDLETQAKLLQFLQTKTIRPIGARADVVLDVQIVAATNKNLREEVNAGNFREDLYQRLKVFPIEIPPLRDRREDVEDLLVYFLNLSTKSDLLSILESSVLHRLVEEYSWIGNIRELANTVKSMMIQKKVRGSAKVTSDCLPEEIRNFSNTAFTNVQITSVVTASKSAIVFEELPLEEQNAYNTLQKIQEAMFQKNGKKSDVAEALQFKSADSLRYRVKTLYEKYPHLFADFARIRKSFSTVCK